MLPERTTTVVSAAAAMPAKSASERPVVPMTWATRRRPVSAARATVEAGEEKSISTSQPPSAASASSLMTTPLGSAPVTVPESRPSAGDLALSSAPRRRTPKVSGMVCTSIRPIRPARSIWKRDLSPTL